MIIKNGLVWEESGSFRKKELVVDTTTHRIAETAEDDTVFDAEGALCDPRSGGCPHPRGKRSRFQ